MQSSRSIPSVLRALALASVLPLFVLRAAAGDGLLQIKYGGRALTLTVADLKAMPHAEFASTNGHAGAMHRYAGVAVRDLLAKAGVPSDWNLRGKAMRLTVLVGASDGYAVAFAISEFDGRFTDRTIYLTDGEDGHPLDVKTGPLALVIPGDKEPNRWVRRVVSVEVQ